MRQALWWVTAMACGGDTREQLRVEVTCTAGTPSEFTTLEDVRVVLTEAVVEIADLRLYEPPIEVAAAWSLVPNAMAHPGHDDAGDVAGELLGSWEVNLLDDTLVLGEALCYEGSYASGSLWLRGRSTLAGTATPVDGEPIPFRFEVDVDTEVVGIPFAGVMNIDDPPTAIRLGMELPESLAYVDWATPDDGDGVLTIADGDLGNTVTFGLVSTPAWTLKLIP